MNRFATKHIVFRKEELFRRHRKEAGEASFLCEKKRAERECEKKRAERELTKLPFSNRL